MSSPLDPNLPYLPQGPDRVVYLEANRAPTILDTKYRDSTYYKNNTEWRNNATTPPEVWKLAKINSKVDATWFQVTGSSGPMLSILPPLGLTPIMPTAAGAVTFTSTGGTVSITGVTGPGAGDHTINFDLPGGGSAIDQINVDIATPPGTDPVLPSVTGEVIFTGARISTGTTAAAIRTHSLALNSITWQIQEAGSNPATATAANYGVAQFDSNQFNVTAGFVQLKSNVISVWQTISANQALVAGNGYMCISPGGALVLTLPTTPAIGDTIEVLLDGATSWQIVAGAADVIRIGNTTTSGGGSLTSTLPGDWIRLVAQSAARWNCFYNGNITVA
jgi:hypothetical protein